MEAGAGIRGRLIQGKFVSAELRTPATRKRA
jgi:hypothetical protein